MSEVIIERFVLDPRRCKGHTFRHCIEGGGLMQLYLAGVCGPVITKSHFGHQSQVRAHACGVDQGVNWEALKKVSNCIQYHLRKRLAVGRGFGRPVLEQAFQLAQAGYALKESIGSRWHYELQPVTEIGQLEEGDGGVGQLLTWPGDADRGVQYR